MKSCQSYSSSCPNDSSSLILNKDDVAISADFDEWIKHEPNKFTSEDCLSLLSSGFDQCPEFNIDPNSDQVDIDDQSIASFEMIENEMKKSQAPHSGNSNVPKPGSLIMRELSVVLLNKLNRKFYSIRFADWLKYKSQISPNKPVFLLGKKYFFNSKRHSLVVSPSIYLSRSSPLATPDGNYLNMPGKKEFMLDFTSRFWFTYRENFRYLPCPQIETMNVPDVLRSSDVGWGCMIRSGQMLLAQGLCMHFLSRSWNQCSTNAKDQAFHSQIIKWFGDFDRVNNPFSIHRIIRFSGYNPGHWFGPFSICRALIETFYNSRDLEPKLQSLEIYFSLEQTIYKDEIFDLIKMEPCEEAFYSTRTSKSVIIFLPLFLGSKSRSSSFLSSVLNKWLRDPCCLGVIGGKPQHAIYMIGSQEKNVIYLDPHILQDTVDVNREQFSLDTFHCKKPLVMPCSYLDPNCAVGFYCKDAKELQMLFIRLPEMCKICTKTNNGTVFRNLIDIQPGYPPQYSNSMIIKKVDKVFTM